MILDYDDLDRAMQAHDLLRMNHLKVTFFPNKSSANFAKLTHRLVVENEAAERASELLKTANLGPHP